MTVTTLHSPTHREALWELEAAFERGDMVTVFGRCTVDYEGRAASHLEAGDRLLILKPDGTALVHTDEKRTPVNWQPPGCEHHAAVREGRLRVRSVRESPDETLDVRFETVHQLSALAVSGGRDVEVRGSEEDLRQRLLDHPELIEDGFDPLATERETPAGPVDVYGEDDDGTPVVVELKRRRVGPDAAGQLQRYVQSLRGSGGHESVRGILVAPSVTDRARELLAEHGLEFVAAEPPSPDETGDETDESVLESDTEESDHDSSDDSGTATSET